MVYWVSICGRWYDLPLAEHVKGLNMSKIIINTDDDKIWELLRSLGVRIDEDNQLIRNVTVKFRPQEPVIVVIEQHLMESEFNETNTTRYNLVRCDE